MLTSLLSLFFDQAMSIVAGSLVDHDDPTRVVSEASVTKAFRRVFQNTFESPSPSEELLEAFSDAVFVAKANLLTHILH